MERCVSVLHAARRRYTCRGCYVACVLLTNSRFATDDLLRGTPRAQVRDGREEQLGRPENRSAVVGASLPGSPSIAGYFLVVVRVTSLRVVCYMSCFGACPQTVCSASFATSL